MSDAVDVLNGVIATRDGEIERLRDELANMYRLHRERGALIDDLAALLVRADSICSLVAAREPKLLDENRIELRATALACRDAEARYREARQQ